MAVVNVKEPPKVQLSKTKDGSTATRNFNVLLDGNDSTTEAPFVAMGATGIPDVGDSYPNKPFLFCNSVVPTLRGKSHILFDIKVQYSTIQLHMKGPDDDPDNPLKAPPDIEWDFVVSSEQIEIAFSEDETSSTKDRPIVNSSGEPFDPPIVDDIYDLVLRVGRNERRFNPARARDYINTVNSVEFLGWPIGTACLKVCRGTRMVTGEYEYYRISYEVHFRADGWKRRIGDRGYRKKIGANEDGTPKIQEITDTDGLKISEPVRLDGAGGVLLDGAEDVWLYFRTKEAKNWNVLDLDKGI